MRASVVLANLGTLVRIFSVALLLPIIPAFVFESHLATREIGGVPVPDTAIAFFSVFLFCLALGLLLERFARDEEIREGEGFVLVGFSYLLLAGLSAIPFVLTGSIPGLIDAYFEGMSGIATVGATVMSYPLEAHPPSVLFWRALTQWIGGMGIIVLGVALLPRLVESGGMLFRAEYSGGSIRVRPKLEQTARSLWGLYVLFTVLGAGAMALALWAAGMAPSLAIYEGLTNTFTAIATAGFSTHTNSIGFFRDPLVEAVLIVVMMVGGASFVMHARAVGGAGRDAYRDEEFVFYVGLILLVALVSAAILFFFGSDAAWASLGGPRDPFMALRAATFNVVSVGTTTGFTTANYDLWPDAVRILLVLIMVTGGMAGSTAGGIKTGRILTLMKMLQREAVRITRPRQIMAVRMHGKVVEERTLDTISAFFFAFLTVILGSTIILTFTGLDMVAAFMSSAATVSTLGPAMGNVVGGPDFSYAAVHPVAKLVLTFNMWFGRLEIFAALLILLPSTYRR